MCIYGLFVQIRHNKFKDDVFIQKFEIHCRKSSSRVFFLKISLITQILPKFLSPQTYGENSKKHLITTLQYCEKVFDEPVLFRENFSLVYHPFHEIQNRSQNNSKIEKLRFRKRYQTRVFKELVDLFHEIVRNAKRAAVLRNILFVSHPCFSQNKQYEMFHEMSK